MQRFGEGVVPLGRRDAGEAGDEVDAGIGDEMLRTPDGAAGIVRRVAAVAAREGGIGKTLHPDGDARDADFGEGGHKLFGDGGRMEFHAPFAVGLPGEETAGGETFEALHAEESGGAAAAVEGVERGKRNGATVAFAQQLIHGGKRIAGRRAGDKGAVGASAGAEGKVKIEMGRGLHDALTPAGGGGSPDRRGI